MAASSTPSQDNARDTERMDTSSIFSRGGVRDTEYMDTSVMVFVRWRTVPLCANRIEHNRDRQVMETYSRHVVVVVVSE